MTAGPVDAIDGREATDLRSGFRIPPRCNRVDDGPIEESRPHRDRGHIQDRKRMSEAVESTRFWSSQEEVVREWIPRHSFRASSHRREVEGRKSMNFRTTQEAVGAHRIPWWVHRDGLVPGAESNGVGHLGQLGEGRMTLLDLEKLWRLLLTVSYQTYCDSNRIESLCLGNGRRTTRPNTTAHRGSSKFEVRSSKLSRNRWNCDWGRFSFGFGVC